MIVSRRAVHAHRILSLAVLVSLCVPAATADGDQRLKTRFTYTATVASVPPSAKTLRIWVPVPSDNPLQDIGDLTVVAPGPYQITTESENGNRMVYVDADPAKLPAVVTISFDVSRQEAGASGPVQQGIDPDQYLESDRLVPISGRSAELGREVAGDESGAREKMRAIYDHVVATMQYDYKKESPHLGEGNVPFVCDYKKGNCSDLHSYVIALARSQGVPAYLEYGFPVTGIPLADPVPMVGKVGGYHCWTWYYDGRGWLPLDASDGRRWLDSQRPDIKDRLAENLVLERSAVAFSRGRDITLNPPQEQAALNFFIYPYAEASGKPVDATWSVAYELAPPDDIAGQIAQLRQLVLAQQAELDRLKGVADAPKAAGHKAPVGVASGEIVSFYGQARLDMIHDSGQMSPNAQSPFFVKSPSDPLVDGHDNDQFTVHPRLTRVGVNLKAPPEALPGWTISGKIEADFHGGGSESRPNPRARLLYADVKHGSGHAFRAGQDWDLISPLWPSGNDDTGQWNAGNIGDRRPQVRYTYDKGMGFNAALAAVLTGAIDSKDLDANGVRDGEDSGRPGAQARIGWKWKKGSSLGLWGARAWEETTGAIGGEHDFRTVIYGIDFVIAFGKKVDVRGEAWQGSNLSDLRGGIGQGINTTTGDEIDSDGGWLELGVNTCAKHRIVFGYSTDDPDDHDLPNGGRADNDVWWIHNRIQLGNNLELGINILDWETDFINLDTGNSTRFDVYLSRKF